MDIYKSEEKDIVKIELTTCPSCGKSIPVVKSCNKCGASLEPENRLSLKAANKYVLVIGLIGIILLGYGYYQANYITPIDQITPDMEGQVVQISGVVTDVDYDYDYEKTSFTVMDITGSIEFFGWSEFTSSLRAASYYPSIGDNIIVEGTVNVYNSSYSGLIVSIEVSSIESLTIIYNKAQRKNIGDILLNDLNSKVSIQGNVTDRYTTDSDSDGLIDFMILEVTDLTDKIDVFVSDSQIALADTLAVYPEVNQTVEIIGIVAEFSGDLEIIPSNATSGAIKILEVP
jgi:DNA/RNA endonuclease YhcR with UshA esterase domain